MINPKSLANLTPFGTIDPDRHREISKAGGIASGASRKRNAAYKRLLDDYFYLSSEEMAEIKEIYHISDSVLIAFAKYIIGLHIVATDETQPLERRERAVDWIIHLSDYWKHKNSNEP